jgi:hypothetical protein
MGGGLWDVRLPFFGLFSRVAVYLVGEVGGEHHDRAQELAGVTWLTGLLGGLARGKKSTSTYYYCRHRSQEHYLTRTTIRSNMRSKRKDTALLEVEIGEHYHRDRQF